MATEKSFIDKRVLVSSLTPNAGGVARKTRVLLDWIRGGGYEPVLAHYEPYRHSPHLSVPLLALGRRKPGQEVRVSNSGVETHALGAWCPEFEFTHFHPTPQWRRLMDSCQHFIAVSGNALAAWPFTATGRSFLAWLAAGWHDDRVDRVRTMPLPRRLLDCALNSKVLVHHEKRVLKTGRILAVSTHTEKILNQVAGRQVVYGVLPVPVDVSYFRPDPRALVPSRIGFSGRLEDPRKNLSLLVSAFRRVAQDNPRAELVLMGSRLSRRAMAAVGRSGASKRIRILGYVAREELRRILQSLDAFVVPSTQEGLCISALEAMACGCPVISTRCGGPEDFVRDGETGFLADHDAAELAERIGLVLSDRALRKELGAAARELVMLHFSNNKCERKFWETWRPR